MTIAINKLTNGEGKIVAMELNYRDTVSSDGPEEAVTQELAERLLNTAAAIYVPPATPVKPLNYATRATPVAWYWHVDDGHNTQCRDDIMYADWDSAKEAMESSLRAIYKPQRAAIHYQVKNVRLSIYPFEVNADYTLRSLAPIKIGRAHV